MGAASGRGNRVGIKMVNTTTIKRHVCEPVGLADIAQRLQVERNTAAQWRLRPGVQFPAVRWWVSGDPAFCWQCDVVPWARETGRL